MLNVEAMSEWQAGTVYSVDLELKVRPHHLFLTFPARMIQLAFADEKDDEKADEPRDISKFAFRCLLTACTCRLVVHQRMF